MSHCREPFSKGNQLILQVLLRGARSQDRNLGLVNFGWPILWPFPVFVHSRLFHMEAKLLDCRGACGDRTVVGNFSHGRNEL